MIILQVRFSSARECAFRLAALCALVLPALSLSSEVWIL